MLEPHAAASPSSPSPSHRTRASVEALRDHAKPRQAGGICLRRSVCSSWTSVELRLLKFHTSEMVKLFLTCQDWMLMQWLASCRCALVGAAAGQKCFSQWQSLVTSLHAQPRCRIPAQADELRSGEASCTSLHAVRHLSCGFRNYSTAWPETLALACRQSLRSPC